MKKIFINGHFLTQQLTGIQRFSHEITSALCENNAAIIVLAPRKTLHEYSLKCKIIKFGIFSGIIWEHFELPLYLFFHKCPLLFNFGSTGPLFYRNRIVSIHDISFYTHPEWFSKFYRTYYQVLTPIFARLSKKIITVSEFSKSEIKTWLKIPDEKFLIIHNAVSTSFNSYKTELKASNKKYILTVASLDPRKNFERLVKAYHNCNIQHEISLKIVGKGSKLFNITLTPEILENSLGYVSDEQLVNLYRNAELFVYPSLYEGFGIPPLEAMSFGCPVILSDIPVFRELYGDSVCYVDPYSTDSIGKGIIRVLSDKTYRDELIIKGYEKSKEFDWNKSALKLIDVINQIH